MQDEIILILYNAVDDPILTVKWELRKNQANLAYFMLDLIIVL